MLYKGSCVCNYFLSLFNIFMYVIYTVMHMYIFIVYISVIKVFYFVLCGDILYSLNIYLELH